jgi:hypothetical protein
MEMLTSDLVANFVSCQADIHLTWYYTYLSCTPSSKEFIEKFGMEYLLCRWKFWKLLKFELRKYCWSGWWNWQQQCTLHMTCFEVAFAFESLSFSVRLHETMQCKM